MINGTFSVNRMTEEGLCRSSEKYSFTKVGDFKIHSMALMPKIPFGKAESTPEAIDKTIFLNDKDTKLTFPNTTKCQNFITAKYIGKIPNPNSPLGDKFLLRCIDGNPNIGHRVFGTESAIRGYNEKG